MYVAVTRPKDALLLTGSYWKPGNKSQRKPSRYLVSALELLGQGVKFEQFNEGDDGPFPAVESLQNELDAISQTENWPLDPLGERHRAGLQKSADAVDAALASGAESGDGDLQLQIARLLAEQEERLQQGKNVELPVRVSASKFKDFIERPNELASEFRRPLPREPFKATRAGTLFHEWVEQELGLPKASLPQGSEDPDLDEPDFALDAEHLQELAKTFRASRFSTLTPIEVEREIQLTIGANTFVCKLDAVFRNGDQVEIVDWKTGKAPADEQEIKSRLLQLALYRVAYARFARIDIEKIKATLYYVSQDVEISSDDLPDEDALVRLFQKAIGA